MMRRLVYLSVILTALLCGCHRDTVGQTLDMAESLMEEHPDSALTILSDVDGKRLTGEAQARHALLLSQAYDKNYIDLTNDSLISIAVDFYSRSDDSRRKMLAYHYHAVVNFNNRHLETGLRSALKAHDIAEELNDAVSLTLIEGVIGAIYTDSRSLKMAYEWNIRALENAKITQNKQWQNTLYFNIADNLHLLQRFKESIAYLDSASMLCDTPDINILELQYLSHYHMGHYDIADSINTQIIKNGFNPPLRVIICQAELNPYNALESLNNYAIQNDLTMYAMDSDFAYAMAYLRIGDINSAIESLRRHILRYNDVFSALNTYMLDDVQHEHDMNIANQYAERARNSQALTLISLIILCLVVFIGLLFILYIHNRHKIKRLLVERNLLILKNEYRSIKSRLNQTESELVLKQNRIVHLEEEIYGFYARNDDQTITELNEKIENMRRLSDESFLKQFSWIDKMGTMYLNANKSRENKEQYLYNKINNEIISLSSRNNFVKKLPVMIAQHDATFMKEIDSLGLINSEREVLLCILCGFSQTVIAILTNKSTRAIYDIKARMKEKLRRMATPFANHILEQL